MRRPSRPRPSLLGRLDRTGIPLVLVRLVLGIEMIAMGWSKAWDPVGFLKLLREYEMFPETMFAMQNTISVLLPWLEIICGTALLLGLCVRGSSLALFLLLTGFTIVIVTRALDIHNTAGTAFCAIHFDCGCGGGDVYMCRKIPENIGLWLLSLIGILSNSRRFCLSGVYSVMPAPALAPPDRA